jgi:hypothetical protein
MPDIAEYEEQIAARVLGDLLTSAMTAAAGGPMARQWLYGWERDGLAWLLRFKERRPDGHMSSAWIAAFLDLNRAAILDPHGKMNFNLRAARLAAEDANA